MAINSVFRERHKKIHLVGIGGIGMSGIARVLMASGFDVSGSDSAASAELDNLMQLGAKIFIGHKAEQLGDADILVFSSAVPKDNPEIVMAAAKNIPIIPRALMLAELMRLRCGIAVSGAHGKTTTTSLIGTLMHNVGLDPTVIIGGIVNQFGSNVVVGSSQFIVTEADESDGTFLHLAPTIAVVTNIDAEHLDYYEGGIEQIKEKFTEFLEGLPFYGLAVVCIDDENIRGIIPKLNRRITTYGFDRHAAFMAKDITTEKFSTTFELVVRGTSLGRCTINMVGHHNVHNVLAAFAVLDELGVAPQLIMHTLNKFNGVKRRFTPIFSCDEFLVIDDYAHHPTEIKAVLRAARMSFPKHKINVLFQPHRYSRTKDFMNEFAMSFHDCDSLVVTDIYGASEKPIANITAEVLIEKINAHTKFSVLHAADLDEGVNKIVHLCDKLDVVLTLGAGSVTHAAPMIADRLRERYGFLS